VFTASVIRAMNYSRSKSRLRYSTRPDKAEAWTDRDMRGTVVRTYRARKHRSDDEAVRTSETSVNFSQGTRSGISQDPHLQMSNNPAVQSCPSESDSQLVNKFPPFIKPKCSLPHSRGLLSVPVLNQMYPVHTPSP
jgi:hypothetical protein